MTATDADSTQVLFIVFFVLCDDERVMMNLTLTLPHIPRRHKIQL